MKRIALLSVLLAAGRAFAAAPDEAVPPGEGEAAARTAALISETVSRARSETGAARRDSHAKAHGCVRALFRVEKDLPADLRRGVFQEGRAYRAWIRYSNGSGRAQNDADGDGRGMAVKLTGVPGPKLEDDEKGTQDFLMINAPAFFVRDAADYVEFTKAAAAGKPLRFFFHGFNPFRWHWREFRNALAITRRKTSDPLDVRYWSVTPFLMGDAGPAKFSARPCAKPREEKPDRRRPDFLREAMSARLKDGGACFEFLVQLRTDAAKMPLEDPAVEWSEASAPFRKLAVIDIPAQRFEGAEQAAFCENLSMNPWHAVPEHRPLGGINRVRRVVYPAIARLRRLLNHAQPAEPTGGEAFPE